MDAQVRAGIDLDGQALRYAEVEQYGRQYRLLRLGRCDFDFDVTEALLGTAHAPEKIEAVTEALTDVYDGSSARGLRVVVHPPHVHSFSAPAPVEEDEAARRERFRREAALLAHGEEPSRETKPTGTAVAPSGEASPSGEARSEEEPSGDALHLTTDDLYTEAHTENGKERMAWFHVLALPEAAQERFERVMRSLPPSGFHWTVSMKAAVHAAALMHPHREHSSADASSTTAPPADAPPADASYTLAVGRYERHLELALCRDWQWRFGLHAPTAAPADSAYYAAALLDQLGIAPDALGRIFLYGRQVDPEAFSLLERLFGESPEPFDLGPILDLEPDSIAADFDTGAYVPCIGAAL